MCFSLPGVKEQHYSNNKLTIENYEKKPFSFIVQSKQVFGKDGNHFYNAILIQKKIDNFTYSIRSIVLATLTR